MADVPRPRKRAIALASGTKKGGDCLTQPPPDLSVELT